MGKFIASLAAVLLIAAVPAGAQQPQQQMPVYATQVLVGTWQLVKFQDSNGTVIRPDDPAHYTLDFDDKGHIAVRFDCNRRSGTWGTSSKGEIHFGPLAITLAECPKGSLHNRLVKDWPLIRSYTQQNGQLFLALAAEGGSYHFEPVGPRKRQ